MYKNDYIDFFKLGQQKLEIYLYEKGNALLYNWEKSKKAS
jgi:hypothetical protein